MVNFFYASSVCKNMNQEKTLLLLLRMTSELSDFLGIKGEYDPLLAQPRIANNYFVN